MKQPIVILALLAGALNWVSMAVGEDYYEGPRMVDANHGWWRKGTEKEMTILHTRDGGAHWTDVSPSPLPAMVKKLFAEHLDVALRQVATVEALDAQRAWVSIIPVNERAIKLEFTVDAGQHWGEKVAPIVADDVCLSFLDEQRGFLLALGAPATGHMDKKIYATEDGGERWYVLPPPDAVSYYPTGISFRSPRDGWITATYHGGDEVPFYRTRDGGKSWQLQVLDIPADYRGGYANTHPPVFIGAEKKQGYLPVELVRHDPKPGHTAWLNYETQDGGETWHLPASGVPSVADE